MCVQIDLTEIYIHTNGQQFIYVDRTWTYKASVPSNVQNDLTVYISYAGSSVARGINFLGPTSVTIAAGSKSVEFEISIIKTATSYQKILQVSGTANGYSSCNCNRIQILSCKSTPNYTETPECESIKCYSRNYTGSLGKWARCDRFPPPKYPEPE